MARFSLSLLFALTVATRAWAQTAPSERQGDFRLSWIDVGAGLTSVVFLGEGGAFTGTVQTRVNLFRSLAVGLAIHSPGAEGFYDVHLRLTSEPLGRVSGFFTMGGLGAFQTTRVREFRNTLPTGDVIVYPAHRYGRITKPVAATFGGGAQLQVTDRVTVDLGGEAWLGQGLAVAMRTALVIGVGPGRYR